jgi:hypothetical protein
MSERSKAAGTLAIVVLLAACGPAAPSHDTPPYARIEAPVVTAVELGAVVELAGVGTDADGTIVRHEWRDAEGTLLSTDSHAAVELDAPGKHAVTFRVQDDAGAWSNVAGLVLEAGTSAPSNHALRLNGGGQNDDGRVKIALDDPGTDEPGPPIDVGATDFTIEWWLRGSLADNRKPFVPCGEGIAWIHGNIVLDRDRYGQDRKYGISLLGGRVAFGVSGAGSGDRTICGERNVLDGEWHHVAVTRARRSGELTLFVDGRIDARAAGPRGDISYPDDAVPADHCRGPCFGSDPYLVLGAEKHDVGSEYRGASVLLDELRFSDVLRYTETFEPPRAGFVADPETVALYHFDEGSGAVAADSATVAGSASHAVLLLGGEPRGPAWEPSTAPTGVIK